MRGIGKRFGQVRALEGVDLRVERGEIHAVVGENGAGKTTLVRILYGALQADEGRVEIDEAPVRFRSAAEGISAGIGMVSQHYSIIGELSCLGNLMLGAEPARLINHADAKRDAAALAQDMGFEFDWEADASSLSPAQAQKLEILKLLWRKSRIMVLDEPTAMLSPTDSDALFASLKQLVSSGRTVILVTHRLPEVLDHCDRVTVLRGGKNVGERRVSETTLNELAEMIVGHEIMPQEPRKPPVIETQRLVVKGITIVGLRGEDAVKNAYVTVGSGEVVGIAGVDGSGQRELFWALMGACKPKAGIVEMCGWDVAERSTRFRISLGLRLIPEDRHEEGLVEQWNLELNGAIGLHRVAPLCVGFRIHADVRRSNARACADRFQARYSSIYSRMSSLSGGNQQRFVAGRALELRPKLLLAFQPVRGLDIDATRAVYDAIRSACKEGSGALVVSYDLDELLEHCDRVLVMNRGKLVAPGPGKELDRETIGRLMVGAA